ncbi:MAG: TIR domain-containing protein [Methylococcales bacterium]|nr:TIR domain-containing protein [Methylococcales bacterium]
MKIKNQTIHGGNQQFADDITNQNREIKTENYIAGDIKGGNIAGRDIHIHHHNSEAGSKPMPTQKTILIVAANPSNETRLRLDVEARDIDEGLRLAKHRDQFVLKQQWATRVRDLRRAMQEHQPSIVHFCGHGSGEHGIVLEDNDGKTQLVSTEALANFFELFIDEVECVVLNACFSEVQAKAIVQHIPFVIGMSEGIGDKAAIEFAVAFYDSLAAGKDYQKAYRFGCSAIEMAGVEGHLIPQFFKKKMLVNPVYSTKNIPQDIKMPNNHPVKLFYSYSHKDEALRDKLETHLKLLHRQGVIDTWDDRKINIGREWENAINENLEAADIILLLISADFLASDYCWDKEIKRAMQKHYEKSAIVIPISLRPCDVINVDFMKLQGLPKDFKPVITWQ